MMHSSMIHVGYEGIDHCSSVCNVSRHLHIPHVLPKKAFYWFDETDDKLQLQKKRTAAVDGLIRSQLFCFP